MVLFHGRLIRISFRVTHLLRQAMAQLVAVALRFARRESGNMRRESYDLTLQRNAPRCALPISGELRHDARFPLLCLDMFSGCC
jgi:hypothetical protein